MMAKTKISAEKVSFEDALDKLKIIVKELEDGDLGLDEALDKFESGVKMAHICVTHLNTAEQRIDRLIAEENGEIVIKPLTSEGEN